MCLRFNVMFVINDINCIFQNDKTIEENVISIPAMESMSVTIIINSLNICVSTRLGQNYKIIEIDSIHC